MTKNERCRLFFGLFQVISVIFQGSKTSSGRRFFNLQEKAKKSIAEPNEPVDWSDYFGIDKREDIDDNANERLKEITFWLASNSYSFSNKLVPQPLTCIRI